MLFLICTSDVSPCPVADQQWASTAAMLDPALLGITPELILKVISWGFGVVLLGFLLGYVAGVAISLIKSI